ncbi:RNA polymerase sigma factor [Sinanaerobacter chloroacetimidivorans]|jgi:RNA polymerase sigma-70 factor (ECF subfamily)|uniref:Sigma-70 family RNA polymerase sigma factor n=1 Tax=Sinanaerobacter chloroacetimidivorans TaxID=2818044 RepID=A0A8J7VZH2_9FIRM|nr:sigma-70 family RNA polymerase sigma factor [Sinanaerobacter chloroacetimidivorans]MBR0598007.1 sigma-70 family RNA polymerase sigma factor [Sinanaerobacter chloroacetimidivorans]
MDDQQLIDLLKSSPSKGLAEAIEKYGGAVKWITIKIIGNRPEEIEECISDIFCKLWKNIEQFDPNRGIPLKSYLYGIARHTALDYRRKMQKSEDLLPIEEIELDIEVNYEEETAKTINKEIIRQTIDEMPSPDKEIFIYRYYFFKKISEIAFKLSLDNKTVENKLYRGRQRLKDHLIERGIII